MTLFRIPGVSGSKRVGSFRNWSPRIFSYPSVAFCGKKIIQMTFDKRLKSKFKNTINILRKNELFSQVTRNTLLSATSFRVCAIGSNFATVSNEVKTPEYALMRTTKERSQNPVIILNEARVLA